MKPKAKKPNKKVRKQFDEKVITLEITDLDTIGKSGDIDAQGRIFCEQGDVITFNFDTGTKIFALFIVKFTPQSGSASSKESPFDVRVVITDDGSISRRINGAAKKGTYEFRLALMKPSGALVTQDPQIIVQ